MSQELYNAACAFCIRVLEGNCHPQETAILPDILNFLEGKEDAASED